MAPKYFFKKCFFVRERKEESIPKPYYQVVLPDVTFKLAWQTSLGVFVCVYIFNCCGLDNKSFYLWVQA